MRPLASDPLRNFKFIVQILPPSGVPNIGGIQYLGFMSADGFGIANQVIQYREGGDNAQPLDSKVLTPTGWRKMGDLQVGDEVITHDGSATRIAGVYPKGVRPVYEVRLRDGSVVRACNEHLWQVKAGSGQTERIIDTLDLKDRVERGQLVRLPALGPVQFRPDGPLPVHPYILGVLLSEGSFQAAVKFTQSWASGEEMIRRVESLLPDGLKLNHFGHLDGEHHITAGAGARSNPIVTGLRNLGLADHRSWEKFIPEQYLRASVEDRLELLRGIMDGDGHVDTRGVVRFTSSSEQLTLDVKELIHSLGGRCSRVSLHTGIWYTSPAQETPKPARDAYKLLSIHMPVNPFYLSVKANRWKGPRVKDGERGTLRDGAYHRTVAAVVPVGEEAVQCIRVEHESHLYVTDDYVVTHNTTTRKMPGQTDYGPLTFGRGMLSAPIGPNGNSSNGYETFLWLSQVFSVIEGAGSGGPGVDFRTNILVQILEHPVTSGAYAAGIQAGSNVPVKAEFLIYNAWPMALNWSGLDAGGNAIMIESLQVAHEGFTPKYGSTTPGVAGYLNATATPPGF